MKEKKHIFIFCLILLLIIAFSYLTIYLFCGEEIMDYNKRKLIYKYKSNEKEFYYSIKELQSETSDIYFYNGPAITIETHIEDSSSPNGVIIKKIKNNGKYKKTINLIRKLKLKRVAKENENILFLYKTPHGRGQYIIYLKDEDKLRWGYDILEFENIKNNWYYVEVD